MRQRINSGYWADGEQISTLEELEGEEFSLARVTIRQAIELLRAEGLLQAQQGRGTFVSGRAVNNRWLDLATDFDLLVESIRNNVLKRVFIQRDAEPPVLIPGEGILPRTPTPSLGASSSIAASLFRSSTCTSIRSCSCGTASDSHAQPRCRRSSRWRTWLSPTPIKDLLLVSLIPKSPIWCQIGLGEPTADCQLAQSLTTRTLRSTSRTSTTSRIALFCAATCLSTARRIKLLGKGARRPRGRPTRSRASGRARRRRLVAAPSFALRRTRFGKAAREENVFKNRWDRSAGVAAAPKPFAIDRSKNLDDSGTKDSKIV